MTKRTLLIWVVLLTFGFASMPVLGFSTESKQTGSAEVTKRKPKKKSSKNKKSKKNSKKTSKKNSKNSRKHQKKNSKRNVKGVNYKHKKGSKKYKSAGKNKKGSKKNSKSKKHSKYSKKHSKGKKNRHGKKNKHSKRNGTVRRKTYSPPTSGNVEYRNYKRSDNGSENNVGSEKNMEKIAPPKEIKKEPKKEGEK